MSSWCSRHHAIEDAENSIPDASDDTRYRAGKSGAPSEEEPISCCFQHGLRTSNSLQSFSNSGKPVCKPKNQTDMTFDFNSNSLITKLNSNAT